MGLRVQLASALQAELALAAVAPLAALTLEPEEGRLGYLPHMRMCQGKLEQG